MLEHRLALLTAAAAFVVIFIGGTVNPNEASLACPEAVLVCHGQLFPALEGKVLYEHGHRLAGMVVGLLQIALTVALLWRRGRAFAVVALATLGMVIVQGSLGALTVKLKLSWYVSTAHLTLAFLYLATLIHLAWRTRPADVRPIDLGAARVAVTIATAAVLAQIVLGALVRHGGAALASIDWPLHQGSLWPAGPLALRLHMAHRIGGAVVGLIAIACAVIVFRAAVGHRRLRAMAAAVPFVVVGQIALGLWIVASLREVPVVVAHFVGAATLWSLWIAMWRMTAVGRAASPRVVAVRGGRELVPAPQGPR